MTLATSGPPSVALPPLLKDNPRLVQWVRFETPGRVTVLTGRVEIGQGVLTAMVQIADDELDVSPDRIDLYSGDTALTPNEGYPSGSQSIQFGGIAMRLACSEIRSRFLAAAASRLSCTPADLSIADGIVLRDGSTTGEDYWSLADNVDLARSVTAGAAILSAANYRVVGRNAARVDLANKVFGAPVFIHDMKLDHMMHARVVRQPRRGSTVAGINEAAIRRAGKGLVEIVRHGNFVAILGADETAVDTAAAAAPSHVAWEGIDPVNPNQEEARWLLQQPTVDQSLGAPVPDGRLRVDYEASFSRMHVAHASIGPSCGLAVYRGGTLQVWTHCQGVYPLRAALARALRLDPAVISVKHAQGPGCYGHNGAEDAAADAAVIAFLKPGVPIRVRWRREEEFGFEPVSPSMVVTVRATLTRAAGQPSGRPRSGAASM